MSAFPGGNLAFGIRLAAKDDTQGALRAAKSGFDRFRSLVSKPISVPLQVARSGLGFLRDVNLGLRPLVAGIDNLIERGAGLEVVRKSFESLTGSTGRKADLLARSLVRSAGGTIRLAEAMQIANRALASGLSFEQLGTAIEFIGKKAISTGKNASEALNTVITGLARGSTLFLDDFGILVDGVEGVKAAFDRVKGAGAFEQLGPAAQKAEIVREAIVQMQQQLGRIGVTGRETIFTFSAIKNQVGDMVDSLVLAVAKSSAMKSGLEGLRDILAGISEHFDKGGTFGEVLFGKGQSGGVFGIAKAALLDAGETIGRGVLGGLLVGLSQIPDLFAAAWQGVKDLVNFDGITSAIEEATGAIRELSDAINNFAAKLMGKLISSPAGGMLGAALNAGEMMKGLFGFGSGKPIVQRGATTQPAGGASSNPLINALLLAGFSSMGSGAEGPTISESLGAAGRSILGGISFDQLASATSGFVGEFQGSSVNDELEAVRKLKSKRSLELSPLGRRQRDLQLNLIERELRKTRGLARQDAGRVGAEWAREQRSKGYIVTAEDQRMHENDIYKNLRDSRSGEFWNQRKAIHEEQYADFNRVADDQDRRQQERYMEMIEPFKKSVEKKFDELKDVVAGFLHGLVGGERALATAGAK